MLKLQGKKIPKTFDCNYKEEETKERKKNHPFLLRTHMKKNHLNTKHKGARHELDDS